jgi:hypothetical protein
VSTLPDLHLKHMGVNLKVVEGLISLTPVSNWPRLISKAAPLGKGAQARKGAVAQLGERLICTQEVAGSNPTSSTSVGTAVKNTWARSSDG